MEGSKSQEVTLIDCMEVKGEKWREKLAEEWRVCKETADDEENGCGSAEDYNEEDEYGGVGNYGEEKRGGRETVENEENERAGERTGERQVASVEEDVLFGQKVGYPTERWPANYDRELTTEPWETVREWFKTFSVTIGPKASAAINSKDRAMAEKTARIFYTWCNLIVEVMVEMPATDLVTDTIPTKENASLRRAHDKLYTPREREWMDRNIPKMLEAGIIDYSISPWCHWTKFVPKKDGDLRMVHKYVPINAATVANSYPICRIELVLNSLMQPGLNVYFQADAANGYWAVPLAQEHTYKTVFSTHRGQYHYVRMGQGLSGAPQTYTRLKDILTGPIPEPNKDPALDQFNVPGGTFQYFMDDDFGAHRTYDDQSQFLHLAYFPRLSWGRFTLRPKKTGFILGKITLLGFVLRGKGLRPSEDNVAAIRITLHQPAWMKSIGYCG